MRTIQYIHSVLLAGVLLLAACAQDKEIGQIEVPGSDYVLPQGGDKAADTQILSLYNTYDSYFLYDFTEKDFNWTLVEESSSYRFEPISPAQVSNLLEVIQLTWLDLYEASFLKRHLPKYIFLADKVQMLVEDWWDSYWEDIPARYAANQMAVGNPGKSAAEMSASEKRSFKNYLQTTFINYCITAGIVTIPDEFAAVSDYSADLFWEPDEKARENGFVYNPHTDSEWSTSSWAGLSLSDDIDAYIASLVYRTEAEWADDLSYPLIKTKYDILVDALQKAGIDIKRIGNATY